MRPLKRQDFVNEAEIALPEVAIAGACIRVRRSIGIELFAVSHQVGPIQQRTRSSKSQDRLSADEYLFLEEKPPAEFPAGEHDRRIHKTLPANDVAAELVGANEPNRWIGFCQFHHLGNAVGENVVIRRNHLAVFGVRGHEIKRSVVVVDYADKLFVVVNLDARILLRVLLRNLQGSIFAAIVDDNVFEVLVRLDPALALDLGDRRLRGQPARDLLLDEQADDLALPARS